jgi:hypothetical protein
MVLKTNLANLAQAAKAVGKSVIDVTKTKMKKPVSMVREAGRTIRRNPKKSAAIGAGLAGSTGFYLYDGKRNAYEDDTTVE